MFSVSITALNSEIKATKERFVGVEVVYNDDREVIEIGEVDGTCAVGMRTWARISAAQLARLQKHLPYPVSAKLNGSSDLRFSYH